MNLLICTNIRYGENCAAINRLHRLVQSLEPLGVSSKICHSDPTNNSHPYVVHENYITFSSFKNIPFTPPVITSTLKAAKFYRGHLAEIISRFNIDVVYVYSTYAPIINAVTSASRHCSVPVVVDAAENFSLSLRNVLNGVNLMQFIARRYSLKKATGIICSTPYAAGYAARNSLPYTILPNFTSTIPSSDSSDASIKKNAVFNICMVSSFVPRECPVPILQSIIKSSQHGVPVKLTIIGSQSKTIAQKLTFQRIKKIIRKFPSLFCFTGFVSSRLKHEYLLNADCFLLMRQESAETSNVFPTRIPEYLSYGKPLILPDIHPFNYYFNNEHDALLVDTSEMVQSLVSCYRKLYLNNSLADKLGLNAAHLGEQCFSPQILGPSVYKFLTTLLCR